MKPAIRFTEVGPRDGFQNWPDPVSTDTKEELVRAALEAGATRVEAASMVHPAWVPQMADGEQLLGRFSDAEKSRLRVLVPNLKGYQRALACGASNVIVNVGATDGFNRHNLNRSVEETLLELGSVFAAAEGDGIRVDGSVSVCWGCPYDGPVSVARVLEVSRRLVEMGVAELSFGDTIGVATPSGMRDLARQAVSRFTAVELSMHLHDTRGMALANAAVALECGIRAFEGSIGGVGGCPFAPDATGNVCSEDLLYMIEDMGYDTGVDVGGLVAAARRMSTILGADLPGRLQRAGLPPWTATTANAKAGMT
ncbi:MAG: hydroxymethylglutaryl-CoA lyase [Candidatus Dormibacteria bacterium]